MAGIMVPVDFSDVTGAVLDQAARLGEAFGLPLTLLTVAQPEADFVGYEVGPQYIRDDLAEGLRHTHQKLQQAKDDLEAKGLSVTALMVPGAAAEKVVEEMRRLEPELIVIGSHGHGALRQLLAGSVCQAVLNHTTCPVLVTPARTDAS